jgi:hypothetical protein
VCAEDDVGYYIEGEIVTLSRHVERLTPCLVTLRKNCVVELVNVGGDSRLVVF